jgi:hypothetical protein
LRDAHLLALGYGFEASAPVVAVVWLLATRRLCAPWRSDLCASGRAITEPCSHSLTLGLIECAESGRIEQTDACTGLDDGLDTGQMPVPRSIHERRAASVAARVNGDSALTQECEDALRSTGGCSMQRRPTHFVGQVRGHTLGEKPAHRGHVIAVRKVPNVAGAHLVLITGFSHCAKAQVLRQRRAELRERADQLHERAELRDLGTGARPRRRRSKLCEARPAGALRATVIRQNVERRITTRPSWG